MVDLRWRGSGTRRAVQDLRQAGPRRRNRQCDHSRWRRIGRARFAPDPADWRQSARHLAGPPWLRAAGPVCRARLRRADYRPVPERGLGQGHAEGPDRSDDQRWSDLLGAGRRPSRQWPVVQQAAPRQGRGDRRQDDERGRVFRAADKLKAAGTTPLCVGDQGVWASAQLFENTLLGVLGPDKYLGLWNGSVAFDAPEVKQAITAYGKMLDYQNQDHSALTWDQAVKKLIGDFCRTPNRIKQTIPDTS